MGSVSMTIEQELGGVVARAVSSALGVEVGDPQVRPSGNEKFGDYQTTVAMSLAKEVGQPPRDIAQKVIDALTTNGSLIREAEIAGPGFVNFHLADQALVERVAMAAADDRAGVPRAETRRRVIVDYSSPNVAKEMHVGHLRSTIIGDALARMAEFLGHEVLRQNHIGDWGTPFGMLLEELAEHPDDDLSDLNEFYRQVRERFDSDAEFAERARKRVVALQSGDPETHKLWEGLVAESERHFEEVYSLLGVGLTHEHVMGESAYNRWLQETVDELRERGIAREDQGAWIVTPEGFTGREGQPAVMIVQKSDGGFTYAASDLAAIRHRLHDLEANDVFYVVGAPQSMHFAMLFQTAREAGWLTDEHRAVHVPFGSVLGEDNKMLRTRAGAPIKLIELLEEAVERASKLVEEADRDVARAVGIGSLKYADLVNDRERDYVFSWDRMLSLDGNTGVYLQYAVARIRSMLEKAGDVPDAPPPDTGLTHPAERALALRIVGFPTALAKAVESQRPHILARTLYDLAQAFSSFYEKCPVLKAEDEATRALRLVLSRATERTLVAGLAMLGIETPQRL